MESLGVEVIVNDEALSGAPLCPHGPMLLFERVTSKQERRQFYACSACRDRKDCRFFQWADLKVSSASIKIHRQRNVIFSFDKVGRFRKGQRRRFCSSCSVPVLPEEYKLHSGHDVLDVTDERLNKPTTLLRPIDNDKKEAQFFFTDRSTNFLISALTNLKVTQILCVGCPRLHEAVRKEGSMSSLLLDIDDRWHQFYKPEIFCHYNMFNHHFFNRKVGHESYMTFLKKSSLKDLALILDPPFGGMIQPLAFNVKRIIQDCFIHCFKDEMDELETEVPVMWIFPYFMEKKLVDALPNFKMLDYEVDYDNHALFKTGSSRKRGSPIRIFTNINPENILPPENEDYRFCKICKKYSSRNNEHCDICGICPSKDGRKYTHCDKCERCVKSKYEHCANCDYCHQSNHDCASSLKSNGCHVCGNVTHKRRNCPEIYCDKRKKRKLRGTS